MALRYFRYEPRGDNGWRVHIPLVLQSELRQWCRSRGVLFEVRPRERCVRIGEALKPGPRRFTKGRKMEPQSRRVFRHKKKNATITSDQVVIVTPFNKGIWPRSIHLRVPNCMSFFASAGATGFFDITPNGQYPFNGAGAVPSPGNGWTSSTARTISTAGYTSLTQSITNGVYKCALIPAYTVRFGVELTATAAVEVATVPFINTWSSPPTDVQSIKGLPYSKSTRVDTTSGTKRDHTLTTTVFAQEQFGESKSQWSNVKYDPFDNKADVGNYYFSSTSNFPSVQLSQRFAYANLTGSSLTAGTVVVEVEITAVLELFNPEYTEVKEN